MTLPTINIPGIYGRWLRRFVIAVSVIVLAYITVINVRLQSFHEVNVAAADMQLSIPSYLPQSIRSDMGEEISPGISLLRVASPNGKEAIPLVTVRKRVLPEEAKLDSEEKFKAFAERSQLTYVRQLEAFNVEPATMIRVHEKEAAEIIFSYKANGKEYRQKLLLIKRSDTQLTYLQFTARQHVFKWYSLRFFDRIQESITFSSSQE